MRAEATIREGGSKRRAWFLVLVMTLAAVAQCGFLAAGSPIVSEWSGWFWHHRPIELPDLWVMVVPISVLVLAVWALVGGTVGATDAAGDDTAADNDSSPLDRIGGGKIVPILLLAVLPWLTCVVMQYGAAATAGKGVVEPFRSLMMSTGHVGFGQAALLHDDMAHVVANYEELLAKDVADGGIPRYPCVVKPPGQLLFYMATRQIGEADNATPHQRIVGLLDRAAYGWPAFAALAVLLLLALGRCLTDRRSSRCAALLLTVAPNMVLMIMHLDQVVYPLLTLAFYLAVHLALVKRSAVIALLAGVVLYLGAFVSFTMLPVLVMLGLYTVLLQAPVFLASSARGWARWREAYLAPAKSWLLIGVGFAAVYAVFLVWLGYDASHRFESALTEHHSWKSIEWTLANRLHYAVLDLTEFSLWVGWPLTILWFSGTLRSLLRFVGRSSRFGATDALALALSGLLLVLAVFGKTPAETGRLWLFLVPLLCLVAGHHFATTNGRRQHLLLLTVICLLQTGCVVFTKAYQDFF